MKNSYLLIAFIAIVLFSLNLYYNFEYVKLKKKEESKIAKSIRDLSIKHFNINSFSTNKTPTKKGTEYELKLSINNNLGFSSDVKLGFTLSGEHFSKEFIKSINVPSGFNNNINVYSFTQTSKNLKYTDVKVLN